MRSIANSQGQSSLLSSPHFPKREKLFSLWKAWAGKQAKVSPVEVNPVEVNPENTRKSWAQSHDKLINEDPLGQVKFVHLFKVTVLNLHVIMIKPKVNFIILAAKPYSRLCVLSCPS